MSESPPSSREDPISAWFAGPKSENGEAFADVIRRILEDHHYWRRNYFPEDGVVITSETQRTHLAWNDRFQDRLLELLAALKADFPFQSPRYCAHMVAEQTLPSIAGYLAGMLYNPNNVTKEAAPVTVELELEAGRLIAEMLGYDGATSWAHLTGGGTIANTEALWTARTVRYLPLVLRDVADEMNLDHPVRSRETGGLLGTSPAEALDVLPEIFERAAARHGDDPETVRAVIEAYRASRYNVAEAGLPAVCARLGSRPVLVVPETYHYCLDKITDVLGIGRRSIRTVAVDERFRMDPRDLRRVLEQIDGTDEHVLAVVAVVGTTEEGSLDPVHEILEVRTEREQEGRPSFWLHADAAYGGYLRTMMRPEPMNQGPARRTVSVRGREIELDLPLPEEKLYRPLERLGECDSAVVDPHKLGYVPYPAGAVAYRSNLVRPVLRQDAPYLEEPPSDPETERRSPGIGMYILEGSKPGAAAASVWLSHTTIPLDASGHGRLIRETVRNTAELHALLIRWPSIPEIETSMRAVPLSEPDSNILCYAFRPEGDTPDLGMLNQLNRRLYDRFSLSPENRSHVYDQSFFVSRTHLSAERYPAETVRSLLAALGASEEEYQRQGVFLLRSTLMNPWYGPARERDQYYLVELVEELYEQAAAEWTAL